MNAPRSRPTNNNNVFDVFPVPVAENISDVGPSHSILCWSVGSKPSELYDFVVSCIYLFCILFWYWCLLWNALDIKYDVVLSSILFQQLLVTGFSISRSCRFLCHSYDAIIRPWFVCDIWHYIYVFGLIEWLVEMVWVWYLLSVLLRLLMFANTVIVLPTHLSTISDRAFSVSSPQAWNSLHRRWNLLAMPQNSTVCTRSFLSANTPF